ncbi:hypothetical protein HUG17_1478 [Dermatophagoides farinae]|uniref:Uncharacterized protein n=1 Tax=Dermatophagoides farinae TaxID=6954 RepID=A0A9D4SLV8_DERFA|nr:hypothetical protein HUG17_1478 [Dermatophagoides farinae]
MMIDTKSIYHCGCGIELLKHAAISIEKKNFLSHSSSSLLSKEIMMANNDYRIMNGLFWLKNAAIFMINYGQNESDSNNHSIRSPSQSIASEIEIDDQSFDDSTSEYYGVYAEKLESHRDDKLTLSNNSVSHLVDCSHDTVTNLYNDHAYAKRPCCYKCNCQRERKILSKQNRKLLRFQTLFETKWKQNQRQK